MEAQGFTFVGVRKESNIKIFVFKHLTELFDFKFIVQLNKKSVLQLVMYFD